MSRKQQAQVNSEGTQNFNTETANANNAINTLMPSYQAELTNPGYTPAQQTAVTGATEGGIGAAFGSANEGAANTAARTNNSAGLTSQQDALARTRMVASGNAGAKNQVTFADAARADRGAAQQGIGQLFGMSTSGANNTLGTLANNAKTPGFWDTFGDTVAQGLGKAVTPGLNYSAGPLQGGYG